MNKNLFLQLFGVFLIIIIAEILQEIICFIVINKRGELDKFKEYKSKKGFYSCSLYLYKNKRNYIVIKLIIFVIMVLIVFLGSNKYSYYDSVGNSYKNSIDIIFYDKNGVSYSIDKDTKCFIDKNNNSTNKSYVDKNGIVSDINEDDLYISSVSGISYLLNGNIYFMNTNVYWDRNNQMHFFNGSTDVIVTDYSFNVDTKTGDCSIEKLLNK
ncbi:hypothetical protein [uncultured Eubacterium sp.]|uniref:hypothetical protein n=1 Tax=uncultured Eubacterium sp. TaxID=165185 RepID=UPI00262ABE4D|nr:hypothetical protein [uncultured Eubacterium sp.]